MCSASAGSRQDAAKASHKLLRAAVEAIREGRLDAEIAFVFSNRERGSSRHGPFFEQVREHGIPLVTLSDTRFRKEHDGEVAKAASRFPHGARTMTAQVVAAAAAPRLRHRDARRVHAHR